MGTGYPYRWYPPEKDPVPDRDDDKATPTEDRLRRDYANLRLDCAELEQLLGSNPRDLTAKDLKRLDKAVTVMKVAFKIVAKVLRKHGFDTSKDASVGRSAKRQDRATGLGPKDEHAVAATSGETPTPSSAQPGDA